MGCFADDSFIENMIVSETEQNQSQEEIIKIKNKDKKKNKKKKKSKNKKKDKKKSKSKKIISSEITSQKGSEVENDKNGENESEISDKQENSNNENEEDEEDIDSKDNKSNEERESNDDISLKESNKKENNNNISKSQKGKKNINNNINNENNNHIIIDDDWLAKFINATNPYNRKNINSSSSPDDPELGDLIISKEKELILASEDIISYVYGNPSKKYKVLDLLENFSFGKIFKAVNLLTKNLVAIKKVKKYIYLAKGTDNPIYLNVKNEIEVIKKLSHPSIVKVYEVYDIKEYYFIINEYCKYGNLYDFYKFHLSEKQICIIIYQILSGVLYLHENNIVHRDLTLEHVMVDHIEKDLSTSEPYFFIKIIGFSFAKEFVKDKPETQVIGYSYYMAPELIEGNYNEKCDIWSVGVILYMLIAKKAPFEANYRQKIFEKIEEEGYNIHSRKLLDFSFEVRDLLNKLLEKDVEKRLSAEEALNHPWFKKFEGRKAFANFSFEDFNLIVDKLFNVRYWNKLQEIVLKYLIHNTPSNAENIKIMKIFRHFNTSGNGKLTRDELKKGLYKYKIKSEVNIMVDDLFKKLEIKEEKDYIEYEKFLGLCCDINAIFTKENLKDVYNFINYDKGEGINSKKIIKAFHINEEEIPEAVFNNLIIKYDKNNDMMINYGEFENIIRS